MASTAAISAGLNPLFAAISGENLYNKTIITIKLKITLPLFLDRDVLKQGNVYEAKHSSKKVGVWSPAYCQIALRVRQYSFILLGGGRH